jgi:hypothetical protein
MIFEASGVLSEALLYQQKTAQISVCAQILRIQPKFKDVIA